MLHIYFYSVLINRSAWLITLSADLHLPAADPHMRNGHFILRKRSCFVRANDRCAAERFNGGKLPDDRLAFNHSLYAKRQRYGNDSWKPFWNSRHRQTYTRKEHAVWRLPM